MEWEGKDVGYFHLLQEMLINTGISLQIIRTLGHMCNSRGNWYSQRSEEVMGFPGTGVKGHCKPPDMGTGKGTGSPGGAVGARNCPPSSLAQSALPFAAFVRSSVTAKRRRGNRSLGEKMTEPLGCEQWKLDLEVALSQMHG